jgi:hypothetical protein
MRFAKWVFLLAGVYGVLTMVPLYFMEEQTGRDFPPPITHPEYYYGFVGLCLAWQVMFLIISSDPVRYRGAMPAAVLEKLSFAVAIPVLYAQDRVPQVLLGFAAIDAVWFVFFVIAYLRTPRDG